MSFRENIIATIKTHGHQMIGVPSDGTGPSFVYTIGLTSRFGFELLMVGLRIDFAAEIINNIVKNGDIELNLPTSEFTNFPIVFKRCTKDLARVHDEYVVQADEFYGKKVEVIQIAMSDRAGALPGSTEYDHEYMDPRQPLFF